MKGTRHRILRAARLLFNEHGVASISQRNISDHIAISPGNLTYHFKKRDDILEALYFDLVAEMDESFNEVMEKEPGLETLMTLTKAINKNFFDYRFFMIDFTHIIRSNVKIKKHYTELTKTREKQTMETIEVLIGKGLMRKAELPREYELLFKRIQLFSDFWIASIGTTDEDVMLKHTRTYTEMFMQSVYPYLTEKGKKEFKKLMGYK